uniref:Uncharacterized protein n=1 Tax=Pinguiococcus pyrenoidosus TaxID=172671 RepID=A0A6U0TVT1_9STRA|mmetsp:Transcript_12152/g.45087  ORF Transcript_12152/g.45087 Transcript_12152/m.45087 type:complete len:212 (+) Transcript_12152:1003-1638(+)
MSRVPHVLAALALPVLAAGWTPMSRRAALGAAFSAGLGLQGVTPALGAYGAAPRMQIQDAQRTPEAGETAGKAVFDAEARAVELQRKVCGEYERISSTVNAALEKGKAKDLRDAQSVLALSMGNIKGGMREVAKTLSGGDILVRDNGIAKFDYTGGTFTYKEVAQLPEDIFAAINAAYLDIGRKNVEAAKTQMAKADSAYASWLKLLPERR